MVADLWSRGYNFMKINAAGLDFFFVGDRDDRLNRLLFFEKLVL